MPWKVTFEEHGGYDAMSSAYLVTNTKTGEAIAIDGGSGFGWYRAWDPAPPGKKERMEAVANAIAFALNDLDYP